MARGSKKRVRITGGVLDSARKKIKSLPKRGRWPRFDDIIDKSDFIKLAINPSLVIIHPKTGTVCYNKTTNVAFTDEKHSYLGAISFRCSSYDGAVKSILDTVCKSNYGVYSDKWSSSSSLKAACCPRISCPYYKKGFIETALKENLFKKEIEDEIKMKHDDNKTEEKKEKKQ